MHSSAFLEVTTDDNVRLSLLRLAPSTGRPHATALLLHGFGQNVHTWHGLHRSFAQALADRGFVVLVAELRGHGRSRRLGAPRATGLADHVLHDLPPILDAARAELPSAPLHLVGHSLGGLLAATHALRHPGQVASLVAIATPARMRLPVIGPLVRVLHAARSHPPAFAALAHRPFPLDLAGLVYARLARRNLDHRFIDSRHRPFLLGSMEPDLVLQRVTDGFDAPGLGIVMDLASWHHSGRLSLSGVSDDLIADLSRLRCPALLVSSHDDAVVPARHSLSPRHLPLARTRAVIHRGFGHCDLLAGMEAPHRVWPDVFRWLGTGFVTG